MMQCGLSVADTYEGRGSFIDIGAYSHKGRLS